MTTEYTEPNINDEDAMDFEGIVGSPTDSVDRNAFPTLTPGIYVSPERKLEIEKKETTEGVKYLSVKIAFSPLQTESGEPVKQKLGFGRLNTLARRDGSLTSVAEYLKAFGVDARLLSGKDLVDALMETQEKPVIVRTGIEEDFRSRPAGEKAKRDDFFKADRGGKIVYLSEVKDMESGRVVKGWPCVYGYRTYKS